MKYGSVKEFLNGISNDWKSGKHLIPIIEIIMVMISAVAIIVTIFIGFKTLFFGSDPSAVTVAPNLVQTMENSPDGVQIQGNGNTIITNPDPEPVTEYSILTSTLKDDGFYYSQVEVRTAYTKTGYLEINGKLDCKKIGDWESTPVYREGIDVHLGVGYILQLNCVSKEPIPEKVGYFLWIKQ